MTVAGSVDFLPFSSAYFIVRLFPPFRATLRESFVGNPINKLIGRGNRGQRRTYLSKDAMLSSTESPEASITLQVSSKVRFVSRTPFQDSTTSPLRIPAKSAPLPAVTRATRARRFPGFPWVELQPPTTRIPNPRAVERVNDRHV
jgi:hypothetical protein